MVKKEVIFRDKTDLKSTAVENSFAITFSAVQSTACDPVAFAANSPVQKVLTSKAVIKMHPSKLQFDFQQNNWIGDYFI